MKKHVKQLSITTEPNPTEANKNANSNLPSAKSQLIGNNVRALASPDSCLSIKSEGNLQDLPATVVKSMGSQKHSSVRVNENNRATLMKFNENRDNDFGENVSEVSESDQDVFDEN